jgi:hypothetical protein
MTLHKITEFYTKYSSICPNITSNYRTTAIFKSFIKENNDWNKTCSYVHDLSVYRTSFVEVQASWVLSTEQNVNFKFQPPAIFVLLFSREVGLLKVVYPLKIYQHTKLHGPTLNGASFASTSEVWKSAILEWLKLRDLKLWRRGHLQWYDLFTKVHKNLPIDSKAVTGDIQTHRSDDDLISLLFPLGRKVC